MIGPKDMLDRTHADAAAITVADDRHGTLAPFRLDWGRVPLERPLGDAQGTADRTRAECEHVERMRCGREDHGAQDADRNSQNQVHPWYPRVADRGGQTPRRNRTGAAVRCRDSASEQAGSPVPSECR